ncbi:unnamed protein product, partial [Phaeothamnion confervicola]
GSFLTAPVEVALPGAAGVPTAVAAGGSHSMALTAAGELYTWGFGELGALGHGVPSSRRVPEDASVPTRVDLGKAGLEGLPVGQVLPLMVDGGAQFSAMVAEV